MPRAKKQPKPSTSVSEYLPKDIKDKCIYLAAVDVYVAEVDPKSLGENPKNWRIHTQRQRSTYSAFKNKQGWLGFILFNLKTKRLLDGHMRVDEAIKNKEPYVPVIFVYKTEEEENEILATFDNIGLLAKRNNEALKSLALSNSESISKIKDKNDQRIKQLNTDLSELANTSDTILLPQSNKKIRLRKVEPPSPEEEEPEELEDHFEPLDQEPIHQEVINDDVFFPGLTEMGIPELIPEGLAPAEDAPTGTFIREGYSTDLYFCLSAGPFDEGEPIGTLGFYTEDFRFEDAYANGGVFGDFLAELDPLAILSPDFSTYSDWPLVIRLYSVYRSRWCARFWQELGFNVIPSIQGLGHPELNKKYVLETLPETCPILSIQCRKGDNEGIIHFIKQIIKIRKPEVFLLYGGEEKQKYLHGHLPKGIDYRYLPQYNEKRRKLNKRK